MSDLAKGPVVLKYKQLSENVFYLQGQPNIGVIKEGNTAVLIDSGANARDAESILKALDKEGLYPLAIINTHAHADHCGGNYTINDRTGALIYAPETEAALVEVPFLEPYYLYSGANPIPELTVNVARGTQVDHVIQDGETSISFDSVALDIIRLPGHSINQIGVACEDILFCGDAIFSQKLLTYYKIPFHGDIVRGKNTLHRLAKSNYNLYVPAHSPPFEDAAALAEYNLEVIENIEGFLTKNLQRKKNTQDVFKDLLEHFSITISDPLNYYLLHSVVHAFLSALKDQGAISLTIKDNLPYWEKC